MSNVNKPTTLSATRATVQRMLSWKKPKNGQLRGVLRVMGFFAIVFLVFGGLAAHSSYSSAQEQAMILGRKLTEFEDLIGTSHRVVLNGESVFVTSIVVDQPIDDLLDRLENSCATTGNGLAEEFTKLPEELRKEVNRELGADAGDGSHLGIVRKRGRHEGMVACLVRDPERNAAPVGERLRSFSATGDLGDVGMLRYAYARKTQAGKTHLITSWTEGSFRVFSLAPLDGRETPGTDMPNGVRPNGAKRLLSATVEGAPHAVRVYESDQSQQHLLEQFDGEMPKLGWEKLPFVADEVPYARAYSRGGVDALIFVQPGERNKTMVTTVETTSQGRVVKTVEAK